MGRISSPLLVATVLEVLEALLVGGRLSLPAGPGTRQSQDTETRRGSDRGRSSETSRSVLMAYVHLLGTEAGSFIGVGQQFPK